MAIKRIEVSNPNYSPSKTQFMTVHSSNLEGRHDILIYNPITSQVNPPVVMLLHGVYGNSWVWMHLGGVHLVYEQLRAQGLSEFILVMPSDGGYLDGSAYLPLQQGHNYEKWIIDDVKTAVTELQGNHVTPQSRWYISGLSMGGYGALRLGSKYPKVFSGVSAHSSITQLSDLSQFTDQELTRYSTSNPAEGDLLHWFIKNQTQLPPVRFDCGIDDQLIESNRWFREKLESLKIHHQYYEFTGEHSWEYWNEHIVKSFLFFNNIETGFVSNQQT